MTGVLEGVRVLDVTAYAQGPLASAILADLGAEVVKVEVPFAGDPSRMIERVWGTPQAIEIEGERHSLAFEFFNRNKRGITLDLKREAGVQVMSRLVAESDVLVHNFRRPTMERLGLAYDDVKTMNPAIVYVWSSAAGQHGEAADLGGFDLSGMARAGMLDPTGTLEADQSMEPTYPVGALGDVMGATMTAFAALAAIHHHARTGEGQEVHASQFGALVWLQYHALATYLATGQTPRRSPRTEQPNPLFNTYRCSDGAWLACGMFDADRGWPRLCRALGLEHLASDPRMATADGRAEHGQAIIAAFDSAFATRPRDEWVATLREHQLIVAPVHTIADVAVDPGVWDNGYVQRIHHDVLGELALPVLPVDLPASPVALRNAAPSLGEHADEILEAVGYSHDQIAELRADGVVG